MKLVVADTSALISLGHVNQIGLLKELFGQLYIAEAVWNELVAYDNPDFDPSILENLKDHVIPIKSKNHLAMVMDYGESESVILYEELNADLLLIDDNKARILAESFDVNCIGSIGVLIKAKKNGLIPELKPIFEKWLSFKRYFSIKLLNTILEKVGESPIG